MRLLVLAGFAALLFVPSFAQDSEINIYPSDGPKIQYATKFELYAGEKLIQESEVSFAHGFPASMIHGRYTKLGQEGTGDEVYEHIGGLILAGSSGCGFSKPKYLSDRMWDGFWQHAQHLNIGELEFYIYAPGADRIAISVDRMEYSLQVARENGQVDLEATNNRSFYGSLEMPYHCDAIGEPTYMCVFEATRDGQIVMESQVAIGSRPDSSATISTQAQTSEFMQVKRFNSLVLAIPNADTAHPLGWHLGKINALENTLLPPLESLELGQFDFHYYLPNADMLKVSLWKINGGVSEGWKDQATFLGSKTVANNQPEPSAL